MPAAINIHPPLKHISIAAVFGTAAINLQQHCSTNGIARRNSNRRYRLNVPLAAVFGALAAVLDRCKSRFSCSAIPFILSKYFYVSTSTYHALIKTLHSTNEYVHNTLICSQLCWLSHIQLISLACNEDLTIVKKMYRIFNANLHESISKN